MPLKKLIQSISLFSNASEHTQEEIISTIKLQNYKKGELLFHSARTDHLFHYIVDGYVKLFRESSEGDEVIIDILSNEQFFGENFIFEDKNEHYGAQAITNLTVLVLSTTLLKKLIYQDNSLCTALLKKTLHKKSQLILEIEHLITKNVMQRIGSTLLKFCNEKNPNEKNFVLQLPYDKSLLAARLGMRPETFSRSLNTLCQECQIKREGNNLHINSLDKLVHYVHQHHC